MLSALYFALWLGYGYVSANTLPFTVAGGCDVFNDTFVNCSSMDLHRVPQNIPTTTTHLYLSFNNINRLQNGDLQNFTALIFIDMSYSNISEVQDFSFKGLLQLKVVNLTGNNISRLDITTFDNARNIEELHLASNFLDYIPDFGHLPKLSLLDLSNNKLSEAIFPSSYSSMGQLEILKLNCNGITQINMINLHATSIKVFELMQNIGKQICVQSEGDWWFSSFKNLAILKLSGNKYTQETLQKIITSLNGTKFLTHLYLDGVISGYSITPSIFQTLSSSRLKFLSLSWSQYIEKIEDKAFIALSQLTELNLKYSRITQIGNDALAGLDKLQLLNMDGAYAGDQMNLSKDFFPKSLKSINLSRNKILISSDAFQNLINLTELSLCNIGLNAFNSSLLFHQNVSLRYLDLSKNKLYGGSLNLTRLTSLQVLNISCNKLGDSYVGFSTFLENICLLTALQKLDLSSNTINYWNVATQFQYMRFFSLANNSIIALDESFSTSWGSTNVETIIDLRANKFDCNCTMEWFRKWMENTKENYVILIGWEEYRCSDGRLYKNISNSELEAYCHLSVSQAAVMITIIVVVVVTLILAALGNVMYSKYKWQLMYWCYRTFCLEQQQMNGELESLRQNYYIRDFYISYAANDEIIATQLNAKIEQQQNANDLNRCNRTYFEGRDATGDEWEIESLAQAIHFAHNSLILLSSHYFNDSRRLFELNLIQSEMMHRYGREANAHILLVIADDSGKIIHQLSANLRDIFNRTKLVWPIGSNDSQRGEFWSRFCDELVNLQQE